MNISSTNIINIVAGNTTVDEYLLLEDENFVEFFKSLLINKDDEKTIINKLTDWINNNY